MAEQAGGTRRRCAADTSGANPRGFADAAPAAGRHAGLGRPGAPPGGHYGPPARSWLTIAMRKHRRKRGPGSKKPQQSAERRAGLRHGPAIFGDPKIDPLARRITGCGVSAPAPVGALLPSLFRGAERDKARPARQDKRAAERWLFQARRVLLLHPREPPALCWRRRGAMPPRGPGL